MRAKFTKNWVMDYLTVDNQTIRHGHYNYKTLDYFIMNYYVYDLKYGYQYSIYEKYNIQDLWI